jgi:alpha-1,3-rhamnosyl/mannosyltransferase
LSVVCIDCRYVNGRPSGIAEMVSALVAHVPAMAPELHFRLLVSPNAPGRLSEAPNVEQMVVRASANGPGTMWWLPQAADLRGVALFHATFNIMPAGLAMPCLTTIHDLMWLDRPEWCESGWMRPVRQAFFRHGIARALDHSALLATVSVATRDAIKATRPDVEPRLFVTASGVSDRFRPVPVDPQSLSRLGVAPDRRFVLTVGQFAPYKNHVGALRAYALACQGRDDVDLVFVQRQGRGANLLRTMASDLGIGGRVHVLPALQQDDLIQLYAAAALLLHPSLCEGFGHSLAEAMACGCPVVTSDRSAMAEVTGDAALLADPTDPIAIAAALARILDDPALANAMRRRGLDRAAGLRWDDFARGNLALYRRALAGS